MFLSSPLSVPLWDSPQGCSASTFCVWGVQRLLPSPGEWWGTRTQQGWKPTSTDYNAGLANPVPNPPQEHNLWGEKWALEGPCRTGMAGSSCSSPSRQILEALGRGAAANGPCLLTATGQQGLPERRSERCISVASTTGKKMVQIWTFHANNCKSRMCLQTHQHKRTQGLFPYEGLLSWRQINRLRNRFCGSVHP